MKKLKKKRKRKEKKKQLQITGLLHYYTLLLKEFLLFSTMPISIETVAPIRTTIAVCLIVLFTVYAFEDIGTLLSHLGG